MRWILLILLAFGVANALVEGETLNRYTALKEAKNYDGAIELLAPLASSDDDAMMKTGYIYELKHDYKNAIKWYKKSAKKSNLRALTNLAHLSERMWDYRSALAYYDKAAALGDVSAERMAGVLFYDGKLNSVGIADLREAKARFERAYGAGDVKAGFYLGLWYIHGDEFGGDKDINKARTLIIEAAKKGDADAQKFARENGLKY